MAVILLALTFIPVFFPFGLPMLPSQFTKDFYNVIQGLPKGTKVAFAGLFSYRRFVQNQDAVRAILRHMARLYPKPDNIKMIFYNFFSEGGMPIYNNIKYARLEEDFGYVNGVDYVVFDFLAGDEAALSTVASNMRVFSTDLQGKSIDTLPIMNGIRTLADVQLGCMLPYEVLTFGEQVARQWGGRGLKLIDGSNYAPVVSYYGTSVLGALDADRGMAEYEVLVGIPGSEAGKMDIRNSVGLGIMVLATLAIVNSLTTKNKKKE